MMSYASRPGTWMLLTAFAGALLPGANQTVVAVCAGEALKAGIWLARLAVRHSWRVR